MFQQTFKVVLDLYFALNVEIWDDDEIDEDELCDEEFDDFMKSTDNYRKKPRYFYYAKNIIDTLTSGVNNTIDTEEKIWYEDGGRLTFTFKYSDETPIDTSELTQMILFDSFEDGMMGGEIGNEILVPTRKKYKVQDPYTNEHTFEYLELGHIECRNTDCIRVELVSDD